MTETRGDGCPYRDSHYQTAKADFVMLVDRILPEVGAGEAVLTLNSGLDGGDGHLDLPDSGWRPWRPGGGSQCRVASRADAGNRRIVMVETGE